MEFPKLMNVLENYANKHDYFLYSLYQSCALCQLVKVAKSTRCAPKIRKMYGCRSSARLHQERQSFPALRGGLTIDIIFNFNKLFNLLNHVMNIYMLHLQIIITVHQYI